MQVRLLRGVLLAGLCLVVAAGCARKTTQIKPEFEGAESTTGGYGVGESGIQDTDLPDIESAGALPEGVMLAQSDQLETVYFDYDSAELKSEALTTLRENAAFLRENPGLRVQIEGHCDERGTFEYNLALGERRAQSVRKFLVKEGVEPSRLYTISYGEERPARVGHDESAWRWNRRAEFRIAR